MPAPVTTRRARGRRNGCPLAAPRKLNNISTQVQYSQRLTEVDVTELTGLAQELGELQRQLDALHAEGEFSGRRHAAVCEAVSVTQRAPEFVKSSKIPWRSSSRRLPLGFMRAINDAFMRPARICDRVRRIRFVLETFGQSEDMLPTKVRRFLDRFDAAESGGAR